MAITDRLSLPRSKRSFLAVSRGGLVKTLQGQAEDHLKALKKFPESSDPFLTVRLREPN